ncbi:MAG: hypothetical protein CL506_02695 [Actinobacteria bacterium]|nr:hypothetical protein [Actinomycetota bacterium]
MNLYLLYFFTGVLGGFFGGLLGLGGGIIFVPFLFFIFNQYDIHASHIMQSAICTSLACIVVSSLSSTYRHNKNRLIDWNIFRKMSLGLSAGSIGGIIFISYLSNNNLKSFYGLFLIIVALYIFFSDEKKVMIKKEFKFIRLFSFFTGVFSSILGIGGGTITTPYFRSHGKSIKESIATAAACGIPIALLGVVTSLLINLNLELLKQSMTGFIHIESFLVVSLTSLLFSYLGASVTYSTNSYLLKLIFSFAILIMGLIIIST